jgi:hypothetical protein
MHKLYRAYVHYRFADSLYRVQNRVFIVGHFCPSEKSKDASLLININQLGSAAE